jgi:hypothetical protein
MVLFDPVFKLALDRSTAGHGIDVDTLGESVAKRVVNRLTKMEQRLPTGMTAWVSAAHVQAALECSPSKAHEFLRAAAGRSIGTGELLRVPVDVWERWARDNLVDGRRRSRWEREDRTRTPIASTSADASGGAGTTTPMAPASVEAPPRRTRRQLGYGSPVGSVLPLIPVLKSRKR